MDEQVSWKGQSFTLLVFGGIVFLCSVFFVLGMLVGRGQGKSAAETATVNAAVKSAVSDPRPETRSAIAPYQGIRTGNESPADEPEPVKAGAPKPAPKTAAAAAPAEPPKAPSAKTPPAKSVAPAPVKMIYLQVTAFEKELAATKQMEDLKKAGFPTVVMGGEGGKGLYKVQVGPYANAADADAAKRKLVALGYKPIKK